MKDIMLKITGRQMADKDDEDLMEFITEGKLYERGGSRYLIYDESEFSGFPGCKTTLKLTGNTVRIKRIGEARPDLARSSSLKRESGFPAGIRRRMEVWIWRC